MLVLGSLCGFECVSPDYTINGSSDRLTRRARRGFDCVDSDQSSDG